LTSTIPGPPAPTHKPFTRSQSIALVFLFTILGAAAQVLMKIGTSQQHDGGLMGYVTSVPLLAGYCLYGVNTVLMVFALRDGELSTVYPFIALSYVWVTMISIGYFHESPNPRKMLCVVIVVLGVAVLGRKPKS
jgi:multidrug transporter EmrE-like cation transporter